MIRVQQRNAERQFRGQSERRANAGVSRLLHADPARYQECRGEQNLQQCLDCQHRSQFDMRPEQPIGHPSDEARP